MMKLIEFKRGWDLKVSLGLFGSKIHIFGPIDPKLRIYGANGCSQESTKFGQD